MSKNKKDEFLTLQRVEKHIINSNHSLYKYCDSVTFKTKNLYNYANFIIRQLFINLSKENISLEFSTFLDNINKIVDNYNYFKEQQIIKYNSKNKDKPKEFIPMKYFSKDYKVPNYDFLNYYFNTLVQEDNPYKLLPVHVSQQTLRTLIKDWTSFFKGIRDYKISPQKYKGRPKLPKYKNKEGHKTAVFTNQQCYYKEGGFITFTGTCELLKTKVSNFQQVRIVPIGSCYKIEVIYNKLTKENNIQLDYNNILGIDLGINNFITCVNNNGLSPFIINGRIIKSINQYYNKQISYYKSIAKKSNNLDYTKRMYNLTNKRNNQIDNFMHKSSRYIINYCLSKNIGKIIIGYNNSWKDELNIGIVNNQKFCNIPFKSFIDKLIYKAEEVGIEVILTEESYTSKASFIDMDYLPIYKEKDNIKYTFSGKRIFRGLYKSKEGQLINSDVNGAYNILRKVISKFNYKEIVGVGYTPYKINIA